MDDCIITDEMSYHEAIRAIKEYAEKGGDICSKELSNDVLNTVIRKYTRQYGLCIINPNYRNDSYYPNPDRETEQPLKERKSGILNDLEWIRNNGFDFEKDAGRYLSNRDTMDLFDTPLVTVAIETFDAYLFEYFAENGYYNLLNTIENPEEPADWQKPLIDFIWSNIDAQSEDFWWGKSEPFVDATPVYANVARLLKMLIYYGCQERGGFVVCVHPDLRISFPGPKMMY